MIDLIPNPSTALQRVIKPNPFDSRKQVDYVPIEADRPLSGYLGRYLKNGSYVYLDGELIPPDRLDQVVPRAGQQAVVLARLAGGSGGKGILRVLAMIAVIAVAIFLPAIVGLFGLEFATATAAALASAGVAIGGSLLINTLIPLKPPQQPNQLQSYGWQGPLSAVQQGSPIAKLYGTSRVTFTGYPLSSYTTAAGRQMTLDALFSLGWGKIAGLSDVEINDNPLSNYPDATIEWRPGSNDQAPVDFFNVQHNQRPEDSQVVGDSGPVEVAGDRSDTQGLIVQLFFPRGVWRNSDDGKYKTYTTQVTLRWRLHGSSGAWSEISQTVSDNVPSPLYVELRADGLDPAKYDIQVEKVDPLSTDETNPKIGTECWLKAIDELVYQDFSYPNIGLLAVRAVATDKLSGNIKVSALVSSEVPDTVAGTKISSFAADNPAVICWDALTSTLYGAGIAAALMDEDAFAEWAAWCDELVPTADPSASIKRSTWNGVAGDPVNVWDFVQSVARQSRSLILRTGTRYTVITDKAQPITQIFTVGNIKRDSFVETWLPLDGRANSITVYYYDEADSSKRKPVVVEDLEAIAAGADPLPAAAIDLPGCTKAALAWRYGMYLLRSNKYLLRSCSFEAASDAIACVVGDVIGVQHDVPQWGAGGRVLSAVGTAVQLDRQVTMEDGKEYVLSAMLATALRVSGHVGGITGLRVSIPEFDGALNVTRLLTAGGTDIAVTDFGSGWVDLASASGLHVDDPITLHDQNVLETRNVVNLPGTSDAITLESAFSADPQDFDVYTFGEVDKQLKAFRVISLGRARDNEFTIKGIEYRPELFEDLEAVLPPAFGAELNKIAVTSLALSEFADPMPEQPSLGVSWKPGLLTDGVYLYVSGTKGGHSVWNISDIFEWGPGKVTVSTAWVVVPAEPPEFSAVQVGASITISTGTGYDGRYQLIAKEVVHGVVGGADRWMLSLVYALASVGRSELHAGTVTIGDAAGPERLAARIVGANHAAIPADGAYDHFTVRAVGFNNQRGAAPYSTAPTAEIAIAGSGLLPHNVTSFRCTAFGSPDITLEWDAVPESVDDAALTYEIRFVWQGEATPTWERATVLSDSIGHAAVTFAAAAGEGTYFIKAKTGAGYKSGTASACYASAGTVLAGPDPIGGGSGDPLPVGCPWEEMLDGDVRLGDLLPGRTLECLQGEGGARLPILAIETKPRVRCVRLEAHNGAEYIGSWDTRFEMPDGRLVSAEKMFDLPMLTDRGEGSAREWSPVVLLKEMGELPVVKINLGDRVFAARVPGNPRRCWSHNMKAGPIGE